MFSMLLICNSINLFSQDEQLDEFSFDSEPLQTESIPYFAIAGGATVNFSFFNYDEINKHLTTNFPVSDISPNFEGSMLQIGGEGFTGLVYIQDMRVAFFSYAGKKDNGTTVAFNGVDYKRQFDYSTGLWGLSLDYAFVPFKRFAILPGVSFAKGYLSINSYQSKSNFDWNNFKPEVGDQNVWRNELEASYWVVKPQVNLEYAITNFLMFRVGIGYSSTFAYDWKFNKSATVDNMPDGINSNGLQIQSGIFLGLFNY